MEFIKNIQLLFGKGYEEDKKNNEELIKEWEHYTQANNWWDPTGKLPIRDIITQCQKLAWQAEKIPKIGRRLKITMWLAIIGGIATLFIAGLIGMLLITLGVAIPAGINRMKKDLIKYSIAKEQGWLYQPEVSGTKADALRNQYPEIFPNGNNKKIEDQYWGKIGNTPFTSGTYEYTVGSGKERHTYKDHYFITKTDKAIKHSFLLYPESVLSKFTNLFTRKEINVESIAFNKAYAFSYDGKKGEKAQHIVNTISPSMQEKLVKLAKKKRGASVLFKKEAVIFRFSGALLTNMQSKITPQIRIDKEDVNKVKGYLEFCANIGEDVAKNLR